MLFVAVIAKQTDRTQKTFPVSTDTESHNPKPVTVSQISHFQFKTKMDLSKVHFSTWKHTLLYTNNKKANYKFHSFENNWDKLSLFFQLITWWHTMNNKVKCLFWKHCMQQLYYTLTTEPYMRKILLLHYSLNKSAFLRAFTVISEAK